MLFECNTNRTSIVKVHSVGWNLKLHYPYNRDKTVNTCKVLSVSGN